MNSMSKPRPYVGLDLLIYTGPSQAERIDLQRHVTGHPRDLTAEGYLLGGYTFQRLAPSRFLPSSAPLR
jgi:hypothetical protein